jgi:CMP-N,N'-diacetyllegionaminic acid synthase
MAGPDAIAIILGRGGSKGLPRKNVLPINGRPCIEWSIIDTQYTGLAIDRYVSSDDDEILDVAARCNTETIRRPQELASDTATVDSAARHALLVLEERRGQRFAASMPVVVLYANVVCRPAGLIDKAVRTLVEHKADSVQSYAPVGKYHPWWMARIDPETRRVRPWEGEVLNHGVFRRQDLPPAFVPDGGVLVVTREALMLEIGGVAPGPHAFFGREDRRHGIINDAEAVIDIDSAVDLMVADAMLKLRQK